MHSNPSSIDIPGLQLGRFRGFDAWLIHTPLASAAVSVFGGQLLSFVPAGGREVMWLTPTPQPLPTPIRGGAPVCWPYFSRQGQPDDVPSHGFVRTVPWELLSAAPQTDGSMRLVLAPPAFQTLGLSLQMELHIGTIVEQRLITDNVGARAQVVTQALHNYFDVSNVEQVHIEGLDGLTYLDKYEGGASFTQQDKWTLHDPRDPGRSDRIYTQAKGRYAIVDPGFNRQIVLETEGSQSVVVWNPGQEGAANMADVGAAWRGYLCVEAANVGPDVIELSAGKRHVLTQRISVRHL